MKFRKIGIVGTGYIGTVIACVLADQGLEITARDTNDSRINDAQLVEIAKSQSNSYGDYIKHILDEKEKYGFIPIQY